MVKVEDTGSSAKMSLQDLGGTSVDIEQAARQKRFAKLARRQEKHNLEADATARLSAIIPLHHSIKGKPLKSLLSVAMVTIKYIIALNGEPNTADERYQEYIENLGTSKKIKWVRALAALIPGVAPGQARVEILKAACNYVASLQRGESSAGRSGAVKREYGRLSNGDTEQRDQQEGDDSDEVEYLATYDISKRAHLPKPKPHAELTLQVKAEEGHTISQSDKHYISVSLGRMNSKSLGEVAVIVQRSAPQFVGSFMEGAFPDIGPLPEHVVREVLALAEACAPPESLRSMMATRAREESQEDNDAMDIDDPEETTSPRKKRSSTRSARMGSKTSFVMIDELQRDLKGLQAALRASGRDQDDIEEYLNKIARGKKTKTALVEMGWKAA